jgi:phage baseplate assembly protein gpV
MIDLIDSRIRKALSGLTPCAIGVIEAVDLAAYQVQCRLKTSGQLTNWLRLGSDYVGDKMGLVIAPAAGDEVLIEFLDWNPSGPGIVIKRLYGKDSPPSLEADQLHLLHKSGTDILIKADGSIEITGVKTSDSSYKSDVSDSSEGKRSLSSKSDLSVSSDAKITISASGLCEISGTPQITLNGTGQGAVTYEGLKTVLKSIETQFLAHMHAGNLGAPTPLLTPFTIVVDPAKSLKVDLGG